MATAAVVKGLQNAINRFYGVTLGSPISVDGSIGPQTLSALNSIVEWMPHAGYDTTFITTLTSGSGGALSPGGQVTVAWGAATVANVSANAAALSNALDWLASENEFTVGATPSPPTIAVVRTTAGKAPAVASVAQMPRGPSQAAAAGILGLGLPDWAVYIGGAGFVAMIALMIIKRKKSGGMSGAKENDYGLTFNRWWRAAGFTSQPGVTSKARDAWYRGEDPSDWRADNQRDARRRMTAY